MTDKKERCISEIGHHAHGNLCPDCGGSNPYSTCDKAHGLWDKHFGSVIYPEENCINCEDYLAVSKTPKCPICTKNLFLSPTVGWHCPTCHIFVSITYDCWAKETEKEKILEKP